MLPLGSLRSNDDLSTGTPFTVLLVCTGNLYRSPIAEVVLRDRLRRSMRTWAGPDLDVATVVQVMSAGTAADASRPMPIETIEEGRRLAGHEPSVLPRRLTADLVARADLVLAMAREHRSATAVLHPTAARHSFTLVEFARVLESLREQPLPGAEPFRGDVAAFLRSVRDQAVRRRGLAPRPSAPAADDIEDPQRRVQTALRGVASRIEQLADSISEDLTALARTTR